MHSLSSSSPDRDRFRAPVAMIGGRTGHGRAVIIGCLRTWTGVGATMSSHRQKPRAFQKVPISGRGTDRLCPQILDLSDPGWTVQEGEGVLPIR
jgi:hypothetical protein